MQARLMLAIWPGPAGMSVPLVTVKTAVIVRFTPPINLDQNPSKLARLRRARAELAAETAAQLQRPEN